MSKLWNKIGVMLFWISWPFWRFVLAHGKRARVIVTAKDKVLVVKPWLGSGKWSLPGGGIKSYEMPSQGAVRELAEETGIEATPSDLRELGESTFNHHGLRFTVVLFKLELLDTLKIKAQKYELADIAWLPVNSLTKYNCSPDTLAVLGPLKT